jgi:hypothetical protein
MWAETLLETPDGVLAPSMSAAVRVFCTECYGDARERAARAVELLHTKYVGSHALCYRAATWYLRIQRSQEENSTVNDDGGEGQKGVAFTDEHHLLRASLLDSMKGAFNLEKADKVLEDCGLHEGVVGEGETVKEFLGVLIKVPEFRQLIYQLCSSVGQASNFLSYMLFRITKSSSVQDGLQEVASTNVYAMHRDVFDLVLQEKIRDFFSSCSRGWLSYWAILHFPLLVGSCFVGNLQSLQLFRVYVLLFPRTACRAVCCS